MGSNSAPTEEELALLREQRDLTQEMIRLLREQTESVNALHAAQAGQTATSQQMTTVIEERAAATSDLARETDGLTEGMKDAAKGSQTLAQKMQAWLNKSSVPMVRGLSDAVGQLGDNFSMVADAITNPFQAALGFVSTVFKVISEQAQKRIQEGLDFANALQEVVGEFGSFSEATSGRIKKNYDSFSKDLKDAAGGADVFSSKFQMGVQGSIERLKVLSGIAADLGPVFDRLGDEFDDSTAQLYVMKQALGFSAEGLKSVGVMATVSSKSLKQFTNEILANTNKIATGLGLSSKVLGKDVSAYMGNMKNLGKMTGDYTKEIIKAAAFTRKLGIELAELTGLTDKFDDFEQGAEAAAQLAAGFGMVLDPLKLMQAKGPADILGEMQKAFAATGRSFENLNRQEKALLTTQSGLTAEQAALAFSASGLAMSYDQIMASGDAASKGAKTQEEVFRDLAGSIEGVIAPIKEALGFYETFVAGFVRALETSVPLQRAVTAVSKSLDATYKSGMRTFEALLKVPGVAAAFEGVLTIVTKLADIFSGIAGKVEAFVTALGPKGGGAATAAKELMTGITTEITDGFSAIFGKGDGKGSIFESVMGGLGETFMIVAAALPGLALGLVKSAKMVLRTLIGTMRGAFKPSSGEPTVVSGLFEAIKQGMNDLITELPSLMPILIEFGIELVGFLARAIQEFPFATLFVTGGPILTAAAGIFGQLQDTITGLFTGGGATDALTGAAAKVDEGTKAQAELAAALNAQGAAMTDTGPDGFGSLIGKFGGAAAKAAEYAAIAFGIGLIGDAIIKLLKVILEPAGASLIDLFVSAGNKLAGVSAEGLQNAMLITGAVLVAALGGIAAMMFGIFSMDKEKLLLVAGGGLIAGGIAGGITELVTRTLKEAIPMISTMISSMLTYLGGTEFKTQLNNIKTLSRTIKPEDMDTVGNLVSIFISIGSMMREVIEAASELDSLPSVPKMDGKGEESTAEKLARIMGYVSTMIGSKDDKSGILGIITKFDESLGSDLTAVNQKFMTISLMLDPLSKMITAFGGAGMEFVKAQGSLPQDVVALASNRARQFISSVGAAAVDILLDTSTRLQIDKDQLDSLTGKISNISSMATYMSTFANSMTHLLTAVQAFDTSGDSLSAMRSLQAFLFGTIDDGQTTESVGTGVLPMMIQTVEDIAGFLGDEKSVIDETKLKQFGEIFSPSGPLTAMVNVVAQAGNVGVAKATIANSFLVKLSELKFIDNLYAVIDRFGAFDDGLGVDQVIERGKRVGEAFNALNSFIDKMRSIPPDAADVVGNSLATLNGLAAVVEDVPFNPLVALGLPAALEDVEPAVNDDPIKQILDSFAKFDGIDAGVLRTRKEAMVASFDMIDAYFVGLETISAAAEERVTASVSQLAGINQTVDKIAVLLDKLDPIALDTAITDFGKNLTVTKRKFDVNGGAVKIDVTLNVALSAQSMAKQLVIDGYVQPNPEFADFLQTPSTVQRKQYDFYGMDYTAGSSSPQAIIRANNAWVPPK